ncbi:MAG: UDP-3-O-acyl-N-acetylglucosamine deacetylase [Pirellulaceae bacterium]|mgnify:CR=1 FL=1|nr:UDP-3-O-acyl-N-acetylglucosamine deacetylase [Pirellulaceae bacterium]
MSLRSESNSFFRRQATIEKSVALQGFGFWSGRDVRVEFQPAAADTGIVFVRTDLERNPDIPVSIEYRTEAPRRTALTCNGASVEMVEHILAALAGLQIDNCRILVTAAEMPGFDGSSRDWVRILKSAGRTELDSDRDCLIVTERIRVGSDEVWVEATPSTDGKMSARVRIDYGSDGPIGRQTYELEITPAAFCQELADARTFILKEEAEWLVQQGLCQRLTAADVLVFDDEGPIENELRFSNECVRHKMLDLVGDLFLSQCDFVGHFVAHCSGHRLNAELVKTLLAEMNVVRGTRLSA